MVITNPSINLSETELTLPALERAVKTEYSVVAFSNLFDLVRLVKGNILLRPLKQISPLSLRAVASLQWYKTPSHTKLNIKMHNKLLALGSLVNLTKREQQQEEISAHQLLQLSPQQIEELLLELKSCGSSK